MDNNVLEEVIEVISNVTEVEKDMIKEDSNLIKDLEIDSLDLVDLVVEFENKYDFKIPDQDVKEIQTVKDIVEYIKSHV